ncbi:MAG: twin-arginine translocation signal domain-containing protein [Actinobacteria bacterium]|nr:MAG: twin-arginine translocation signal domain-containing protein [Actinomycetota bacterium]
MSTTEEETTSSRYSRRGFLKRAGVGAGAVAMSGGLTAAFAPQAARSATVATSPTTFGRIFPSLPPFAQPSADVQAALLELGKPGGLLDAKDDLSKGPVLLITDLSLSANNRNNPTHTAGTTFMGQFVDHDITFDTTSKLGVTTDPGTSPNARTPSLDLDSVYGAGPVASAQLYDPSDHDKLAIGFGGLFEDHQRAEGSNAAIIPDPRNDENMMIAGLHCAFMLFHNKAVDWARDNGYTGAATFEQARQLTTWHYHWMVLKEFLPLFVGQAMVDDVLKNGRRFYKPRMREGFMPVEFQAAAYRFGHSMVRPSYRANLKGNADGGPFFGMVFDPAGESQTDPVDLRGGARAPRRFIGWQTFFDFGDGNIKPNKQIDTKISTALFNLPLGAIASHDTPQSLPQRNLLRQLTWSLPSGQKIADAMNVDRLGPIELAELGPYSDMAKLQGSARFEKSTPLWYYVLKEAELRAGGLTLGPVGGRIVAEVLIGLIQSDPSSYLVQKPKWTPTLGRAGSSFRMKDFLTFAGVDPASRHAANPDHA